jgi:hypothetical protein
MPALPSGCAERLGDGEAALARFPDPRQSFSLVLRAPN